MTLIYKEVVVIMNENIGKFAAAIHRNVQMILNSKLKNIPIKSGQYDFFYVISLNEGITQKELSEWLYIGKSTTAKAVKNLVDYGYVRKEKNEEDKRYEYLYLTEKGRAISDQISGTFKEVVEIMTKQLSQQEIEQTKDVLKKILNNVMAENKKITGDLDNA